MGDRRATPPAKILFWFRRPGGIGGGDKLFERRRDYRCKEVVEVARCRARRDAPGDPGVPERKTGLCSFWEPLELDELARIQGVEPVKDVKSLAAPIWESDEELEEFLGEVYRARRSETVRWDA